MASPHFTDQLGRHQDGPPAYTNLATSSSSSCASTTTTPPPPPEASTNTNAKGSSDSSGMSPALQSCTLDKYDTPDSEWGTITIRMVPDPTAPDYRTVPWAAFLFVKSDVSCLMDEGFYWSVDNVIHHQGLMGHGLRSTWEERGFRHVRKWALVDTAHGDSPCWVARLEVMSPFLEVLSDFPLQDLTRGNICSANAWNPQHELLYNYNIRTPDLNYNCVFNDRPLHGWWPWPRDPTTAPSRLVALNYRFRVCDGKKTDGSDNGGFVGDELFPCLPVLPQTQPGQERQLPRVAHKSSITPGAHHPPPNTNPVPASRVQGVLFCNTRLWVVGADRTPLSVCLSLCAAYAAALSATFVLSKYHFTHTTG